MKLRRGFTLVEMLVVVAIIAILASVFLIGLRGFRGSAYDARRLSDLQKVQSYLELYYNKNRQYPGPGQLDWDDLSGELAAADIGIQSIPNDPLAGGGSATYYYGSDSSRQRYVLGAKLSDPDSSTLKEGSEVDGTMYGVDCDDDDGIYCVLF